MVGCGALDIDPGLGTLSIGETILHTGDLVSLDGTTGEVHSGAVQLSQPAAEDEHLAGLLALARQRTSAQVFARITTPAQVTSALGAGADGIVAGVDSVLAASGRLQEVIDTIAENDLSVAAPALERAVAEEFALQAAMIGVPARHLLTAEPLDAYLRRGLIGVDPRVQIDIQAGQLIDMVAAAAERRPRCRIGARLTGPVPAPLAEALARRGFNVVAVNADEVRTTILALGRAAPA
ncbi:hypothetical protein ACFYXQ_35010 [Nocardia jiangxiensis]|uniref:Uncharacterized protein n=1 Tax=Nocardia jiangxiensis TaxID=282685 RepID=A0ABW6S9L9_9NOCA